MPNRISFTACLLTSCTLAATLARGDDWPSWRGAGNTGISRETGLPAKWSATEHVAWKLAMPGKGGSTPVVWKDRIFLTSAEGNDLILVCVGTEGKLRWKQKLAAAVKLAIKYDEGNEASASPSTDGQHVYTFVGSGQVSCHDFEGKQLWQFNAQERYGRFSIYHGIHNTPLLHEDRLYLVLLHAGGHWVVALDKATGKEMWKHHRKSDAQVESRDSYASPILWEEKGEQHLVVLGADYCTAHRLTDGTEVWRLGDLNPKGPKYSPALRIIASPVASKDLLVVPTARGGLIVGLKPGAAGPIGPGSPFELWRKAKGAPDVPSPLIHDGLVYLAQANGVLNCWDAVSGKEHYAERLHPDRYRCSPVYADGKIYAASRDGTFTVVKAGPKYEVLATNNLPDVFTASPAIAGGRIYLRGFENLYAIGQ